MPARPPDIFKNYCIDYNDSCKIRNQKFSNPSYLQNQSVKSSSRISRLKYDSSFTKTCNNYNSKNITTNFCNNNFNNFNNSDKCKIITISNRIG